MKKSFLSFFIDQFSAVAPVVRDDLTGKTVIVIGANTGLGFEAVKHFASMNPGKLILGCRSEAKGQSAVKKLAEETGYKAELWLIDLSHFSSVKAFATRFEQTGGRLDILVMNAAILAEKYEYTSDGWETCLQVNNLSTSLLSLLLLPTMVRTARDYEVIPRLVIVSSEVHYWIKLPENILNEPKLFETLSLQDNFYKAGDRYFITKLFNILFTRALASRLSSTSSNVVVTTSNPGFCVSEIRRDFTGLKAVFDMLMTKLIAFTTEQGSRALVWGALGGKNLPIGELNGAYTNRASINEPSDYILSETGKILQERIWDETIEILSKVDDRISQLAILHQNGATA